MTDKLFEEIIEEIMVVLPIIGRSDRRASSLPFTTRS